MHPRICGVSSTVAEAAKRPEPWLIRRNMTVTAAAPSGRLKIGATTVKPSPLRAMIAPAISG